MKTIIIQGRLEASALEAVAVIVMAEDDTCLGFSDIGSM